MAEIKSCNFTLKHYIKIDIVAWQQQQKNAIDIKYFIWC